ncbi:IS6 family transposase [Shewanella gaetbuli]|uniref:IS6 family transposase n=1 Tax=Shewanella gaetbuli TaxID=220752 RepID=A0A9X1ZMD7_9GAMM|nr:IS6 family transposase [Shewanella gaetbuli]MCL1142545.1 IS6 family transposase [Shewanella gaetbuli]
MKTIYPGHRYPAQIISHAVYLYHRFTLSLRDIEEILAYRGINVTYETISHWCLKFGNKFSHNIRTKRGLFNSSWYLDEVFIKINGRLHYLWREVDSNGDEIDILVQKRNAKRAVIGFFRKLLKGQHCIPGLIVTDKLPSYRAAKRVVMTSVGYTVKLYN